VTPQLSELDQFGDRFRRHEAGVVVAAGDGSFASSLSIKPIGYAWIAHRDYVSAASVAIDGGTRHMDVRLSQVAAIATVRYIRRFMAQPALSDVIGAEVLPGTHVQSDEEMLESFRRLSTSGLQGTGSSDLILAALP
jgi:hypothetical protein